MIKKNCYLIFPFITVIITLLLDVFFNLSKYINDEIYGSAFGGACAIIGFLITSLSIFSAFNKDSSFMRLFTKSGHLKILYRAIKICGMACIAVILFGLVNILSSIYLLYLFGVIITELCIVANYIIFMSMHFVNKYIFGKG